MLDIVSKGRGSCAVHVSQGSRWRSVVSRYVTTGGINILPRQRGG